MRVFLGAGPNVVRSGLLTHRWLKRWTSILKRGNGPFIAKSQPNIIEAFHQAPLRVVIDVKAVDVSAASNGASFQIHGDFHVAGFKLLPNQLDVFLFHQAVQHASLAEVAAENIGKTRGKYGFKAVISQCPNSMLTRRTRTKISAGE